MVLKLAGSVIISKSSEYQGYSSSTEKLTFTVKLNQDKIPDVGSDGTIERYCGNNYRFYVLAWRNADGLIRIPLYCEPSEAYKTIDQAKVRAQHRMSEYGFDGSNNIEKENCYEFPSIRFSILCVGVQ